MKKHKLLKVWQLALIDITAVAIALCIFAYFDHVRPQELEPAYVKTATAVPTAVPAAVPANASDAGADVQTYTEDRGTPETTDEQPDETVQEAVEGEFSFPGVFTDGEVIVTENSYKSANISITVTNVTQSEPSKQSYFVEDIYVRNIDCMQTVFAKDKYGKSQYEDFMSISNRVNSIASINTDMYGWGSRTGGLVIRNGVLYRDKTVSGEDMCVIYRDGTMDTIIAGTKFDAQQLVDDGAWQAFSFGPSLLDGKGNMREDLEKTKHDPRTVIGMIEPGHYVFIVFDGRQDSSYAKGYTYRTSAQVCIDLGCKVAFNLDGGESSQMSFNGKLTNHPYKDGRYVTDILYITEPQQ